MKRLDRFILKSFMGPFFGILAVVVFIFMMQCLWLYIDELVGKGLGLAVVLEFLFWGSCTMLPTCLPLATLLASVMTVGQMSENFELTAMKSAGISVMRIFSPLIVASVVISIGAYFVSNNLVPVAFNKIYTLRDDFRKTKEEVNIPVGMFYDGIDGYVLRVEEKDKKTGMMHGVMVYDHTGSGGNTSVTLADSATMQMSKTKDYITFQLFDGINYQETNSKNFKDTSLQVQQISFSKQSMLILLENYSFQKSEEDRYGDQIKAQSNERLRVGKDTLERNLDSLKAVELSEINTTRLLKYVKQLDTAKHYLSDTKLEFNGFDSQWSTEQERVRATERAMNAAKELSDLLSSQGTRALQHLYFLRRTNTELLSRIAQALLCLVLFFIGAPLGSFSRRGGLGASAIIAVLFFVLYWVVNITGTKLAKDGAVNPAIGAFISAIVMAPIGVYMTVKAAGDAELFNLSNFSIWRKKYTSRFKGVFRKTRIVYMGTPEFAVAPLEALMESKHCKVVGVVTVADKPGGRGLKMTESAVKKYALEHKLPLLQPVKLKDPEFLKSLAAWKGDLFVVTAFRMLPEEVWRMPPLGSFNLHASLLPQYRGAAPINWAIINGERLTGVTTFMLDKNMDTGGIILRQDCRIAENDTAGDLHDKLMPLGAKLVLESVQGLVEKNVETRVQRSFIMGAEVLRPAPKLTKALLHVDWNDSTKNIHNLIRGLSPHPAAFTELEKEGKAPVQLKIFKAVPMENAPVAEPGTLITDGKSMLAVTTSDGAIELLEVQLAGKKRMDTASFLLGFRQIETYRTTAGSSKAEIAKTKLITS